MFIVEIVLAIVAVLGLISKALQASGVVKTPRRSSSSRSLMRRS